MFEDDVAIDVAHDQVAAPDQMDGPMPTLAVEKSAPSSPAPAALNGHTQDQLQEINQLINDLEAATEAQNANVVILRGKLAVSQQQLETKAAELEDLKEEAELALQQLLAAQVQLEEQCLAIKESKEENELILLQLHQAQEELEDTLLDRQEKEAKLEFNRNKCDRLESEIANIRGEADLFQRQLSQAQKELKLVVLDRQEKEAKLKFNRNKCDRLESEIANVRGEADLSQRQLHRVQEELELYFVDNQRKEDKLSWLRGQRELLIRMLRLQSRVKRRFNALDARTALPAMIRQTMPWWKRIQRS